MKNILNNHWPILIMLGLSLLTTWPLFLPGYFSHHDDLQVMRIFEMRKCLEDLQIPCRWVPDMGYGNGYPLFNYYAVFPYYIGALTSFFIGYVFSAKLLFLIPLILSSLSMYLLARQFSGVYPALAAGILYTFAPYKALDSYVRGDVTESFSMAIIPLVLYFGLRLINTGNLKFLILLSFSLAFFLISHNIMTVLFAPVILLLSLFWLNLKKFKNWKPLFSGLALGMGLSAFFIFPAYFEKELVQIDNLTRLDLNFRAHFVTINQLFWDREWGYGASKPGTDDTISFQIGWPHWWIVVVSVLWVLKIRNLLYFILFAIFLLSIFMIHVRSAFIWEQIPILRFTQFPWRFLAVTVFSVSLIAALFLGSFKDKIQKYAALVLIVFVVYFNWSYFRPEHFYPNIHDTQKLSGKLWETQQKAAILDYLPKGAVQPREPAPKEPILISGNAEFENFKLRSNSWQFKAIVKEPSVVEVPVFDFPNWQVFIDSKKVEHNNKNYLGRISFNLNEGEYLVVGKFLNTAIRTYSNLISAVCLVILVILILYGEKRAFYAKSRKIFK